MHTGPVSSHIAPLNASNTCQGTRTSTSTRQPPEAALSGSEPVQDRRNRHGRHGPRSFRPELVRTEFYDRIRVAHYNIVDNGLKPLAAMNLAVPADNLETLGVWENQLRAHIESCWQLASNDSRTAMHILCATLDQIPGSRQIREPRLTNVDVVLTRTGVRTVDPPIPHLWLPNNG